MPVSLWQLRQGHLHETAPAAGLVCCASSAENAQQAVIAGDDDKDLLKQQGSLQDAVFGVSQTGPAEPPGLLIESFTDVMTSCAGAVHPEQGEAEHLMEVCYGRHHPGLPAGQQPAA